MHIPLSVAYAIHNSRGQSAGCPDRCRMGSALRRFILCCWHRKVHFKGGLEVIRDLARLRLVSAQQMDMDLIGTEAFPVGRVACRDVHVPKAGKSPSAEHGPQIAEAAYR